MRYVLTFVAALGCLATLGAQQQGAGDAKAKAKGGGLIRPLAEVEQSIKGKLERINRHFDHVIDVTVFMSAEKLARRVELNVHLSGRDIFVSVPIPANDEVDLCDPAEPNAEICAPQGAGYYPKKAVEVTFSFYVGGPGVYQWNCEYPCGGTRIGQFGNAMSTWGYMSGTLTVK